MIKWASSIISLKERERENERGCKDEQKSGRKTFFSAMKAKIPEFFMNTENFYEQLSCS